MEPKEILQLYDLEMRIDPTDWQAEIYRNPGITYLAIPQPSPYGGWVLYTDLKEADADAVIHTVIQFFETRGSEFEWKVYDHDRPADLKDRLRSFGFVAQDLEALLAFDLETAPQQFWKPVRPEIRTITNPSELNAVAQIQAEVWDEDFDGLVEMLGKEMRENPQGISIFIAEVDGRPVSSAWIRYYENSRFAELFGGSTVERFRGMGFYTSLIMARAQEARSRGVRFMAVDASPMSQPILEKLGFVFLTHSQPFTRAAANTSAEG